MVKNSIYIILILLIFFVKEGVAQNQKIGFIDSDMIMERMPEYSGIEQRLSLLSENWRSEIEDLEVEIEDLESEFEAREILFTEEIRQQRLAEINSKKDQLSQLIDDRFGPQGDYFTRQKELLEPIQRQIFDALNRVATRDSYNFVFDRSQDTSFLFVDQEWNLTEDVMLEMGIDISGN